MPRLSVAAGLWAVGLAACPSAEPALPTPPATELVCDRDYAEAVDELIDGADQQLLVAQWEFFAGNATDRIFDRLVAATGRGVQVRVLLDDTIDDNHQAVERLQGAGIEAVVDSSDDHKLHAKLLIADDQTALIGSTNWSTSAIDWNHECNLLVGGPSAAYLGQWWSLLREDTGARTAPSLEQPADAATRALVDDELLPTLLDAIAAADQRVDFTMYATFLQPDNLDSPTMQVFSAFADAASRGVEVRGVADWSDWNSDNNDRNAEAVNWLVVRGVQMRWDRPDVNMHAKTFRTDSGLQVQSANISSSGFAHNREAGAWTTETGVLADFDEWFDALWELSTEEPP